jgi:hypothetical protein
LGLKVINNLSLIIYYQNAKTKEVFTLFLYDNQKLNKMNKNLLIILLLMLSVMGFAQTTTSSMSGTVLDDVGEPLAGASVVAIHTPTGSKYGSVSQFSGNYAIRNMKVGGPYTVTVSYVGFQNQEVKDVYLQLGQTFNLNVKMTQAGEELEAVVLDVSKNNTFNSGRTGAETSLGAKELSTMPSISRSAADFYRLDPSSSGGSFGGRNDQFNNFTLDGSIFNNPFGLDAATPGGQTGAQPISIDAIEQIQVSTAPYDVSLSGFTGAAVNAVTKSGTNEVTGTVYGFYRNQDLTGSKVKGEDIFVPELKQLQYGVSVGGPIIKNKLFFFANFEKEDRTDAGSNWVPNNGDGVQGINESSVLLSDMQAVKDALSALGYDTGAIQGFTHESGSTKGIIKLDYNLSDKHKLAFVYNFLDASKEKPAHPTAIASRGPNYNTLQFENSGYQINNKIQSFLMEMNSNLSDKISNKFQMGYTHFDDFRNPKSTPAPSINIFKGGNNYIVAGHEPFSVHNRLDQKVFQISDNLNILLNKHNVTLGYNFEKFMFKNSFNLFPYGFDLFGHVNIDNDQYTDFNGNTTDYGYIDEANNNAFNPTAFKQFLIDYYGGTFDYAQSQFESLNEAGAGNDNGWRLAELNVGQLAGYIQDEWSATDYLKLTFGVRFDKPMYFNTSDLIQKYMDTDNGASRDETLDYYNPNSDEMVKLKSTTLPTDKIIISPRFGFNWDVKGDKTIQVRGGTGIFTGRLPFVWLGNQVSGADDGYFQIVDKDFEWPRVWKSSFGIDHKHKSGFIGSFDFSYTKDLVAAHVQNWNLRNPTGNLVGVDNRPYYEAADFIQHQPWGAPKNAYVFTNSDQGYAFNATAKVAKSFDNGLYTSIAYNYMEAKSVNSIEAEITGDAFDFNPNLGDANEAVLTNSKYGDKHRVIGVVSKKFSYGGGKHATTFSTFIEYAQGGRFSYTYAGNINNDSSFQNNDLIYIPTESEISSMNFADATQAAAWNEYIKQDDYLSENRGGYAERYGALSPWRSKWDIKIMQDYKVSDSNKIQFSIDILNAGNLLNSDWGVVQAPRNVSPIGVTVDPVSHVPTYTFDGTVTETFAYDASLLSRWQMQFGLRYIF